MTKSKVPGYDNTKKAIVDYLNQPSVTNKLKKEVMQKVKDKRLATDKKFFKTNKGKRVLKTILSNYKNF